MGDGILTLGNIPPFNIPPPSAQWLITLLQATDHQSLKSLGPVRQGIIVCRPRPFLIFVVLPPVRPRKAVDLRQ